MKKHRKLPIIFNIVLTKVQSHAIIYMSVNRSDKTCARPRRVFPHSLGKEGGNVVTME